MDNWQPNYEIEFKRRAGRLKTIRATPGMLGGLKKYYTDHPVEFINDFGMTFDPRNAEIGQPASSSLDRDRVVRRLCRRLDRV